MHNRMMRNIQESIVGSIQIHQEGYFKKPRLEDHIKDPTFITDQLESLNIHTWSLRLKSYVLAAGADTTTGILSMAIDPMQEQRTTKIAEKISSGRFFTQDDDYVCILGRGSARILNVGIGDELVLLGQDRFDALAAERFTLIGMIDSGEMGIDKGLVLIPLKAAQDMMSMQGRVSDVVVLLPEDQIDTVYHHLKDKLQGQHLEVLRWFDMFPTMKEWVYLDNAFYYIFLGIVLLIVVAGVLNTVLMSMLERVHEFGVMMGLGVKSWQIALMILIESTLLGLTVALLGTTAGLLLVGYYGQHGIDLSDMIESMEKFYLDPVVYTQVDTDHLVITISLVVACNILASLYPAWRATRLEAVEAIRHV